MSCLQPTYIPVSPPLPLPLRSPTGTTTGPHFFLSSFLLRLFSLCPSFLLPPLCSFLPFFYLHSIPLSFPLFPIPSLHFADESRILPTGSVNGRAVSHPHTYPFLQKRPWFINVVYKSLNVFNTIYVL